ncbi:MAG TPA: polyamine ABC transporter substrate-binding protein [Casimicrobiaceae bacterium]|nr:polyamine ABC transporter substrate-binding protein [Casimicrobiaceae bacterium]
MGKSRARIALAAGALALSFGLFAGSAQAVTELTVIVYGGSFEAGWKKAVIEPFEAANPDIKVRIATGLTMETVAMMRAQKADPKIDVIMMDEVGAAQANGEGLYQPLDVKAIPNMAKLYPQFRTAGDPYTKFMYVAQVIAYDKKRVKGVPQSYQDLWKPEYKGKIAIPDINTSHGTMFLMMAARMNGGSIENIDPGFAAIKKLKPSIVTFWNQHAQVSQLFTQGDIVMTTWTSDRAQGLIDSGGDIGWTIPKESAYIIDSTIGIAKGTKNLAAAQKYIDFVLSEKAQEANAKYTYLTPVNREAKLDPAVAAKLPSGDATLKRMLVVDWTKVTRERPKWVDRWNREITSP